MLEHRDLTPESRGMLKALLLADRSDLGWEARDLWRSTGAAHFLALSGLHLGLLSIPVFSLLSLAGARGCVRDSAALFLLSAYTALAGYPSSLIRALSLIAVMRLFRLRGVRSGLSAGVITGGAVVCALDPGSLRDAGFMLSMAAASGIAMTGVEVSSVIQGLLRGRRHSRLYNRLLQLFSISFCVQAFILPITVNLFGSSPVIGPIMSAFLAVPVTCLLYSGVLFLAAGAIGIDAAARPVNLLVHICFLLVRTGSRYSAHVVAHGDFHPYAYICGLSICSLSFRSGSRRLPVFLAGAAVIASSFIPSLYGMDRGSSEGGTSRLRDAALYGGSGGILVLPRWPRYSSATCLVRRLFREGVRTAGTVVVREPLSTDVPEYDRFIRYVGPEVIFVSPWSSEQTFHTSIFRHVVTDTIMHHGDAIIEVRRPDVLPGPGASARGSESFLSISPLD